MDGASAEFFQRAEVAGGAVALVAGKIVAGKIIVHGARLGIPRDLARMEAAEIAGTVLSPLR